MNFAVSKASLRSKSIVDFQALLQLTKPTISMLVVFTAWPALVMASDDLPSWSMFIVSSVGIFLASGSAAVLNHLADSDIDGSMRRTSRRPLPAGRTTPYQCVLFSAVLGLSSFLLLYHFCGALAALLSLAANFFYVVVYTLYLKRRTSQNIVIGGAAGAVGPLIGWAAVTGTLSWESWVMFLIIFLWTPPHFWALALKYKDDYQRVNIPMLPNVKGERHTRLQILLYSVSLLPAVLSLYIWGDAGVLYISFSMAATVLFSFLAFRLWRRESIEYAMPVFFFSLAYIFIVFGVLTVDQFVVRLAS